MSKVNAVGEENATTTLEFVFVTQEATGWIVRGHTAPTIAMETADATV